MPPSQSICSATVIDAIQLTALAFTAGPLLVADSEEIISEAHEAAENSLCSMLAIVGGFVLFAYCIELTQMNIVNIGKP